MWLDQGRTVPHRLDLGKCTNLSPRIVVLGLVIGLLFRLAVLACVDYPLTGVAAGYDALGRNLADHQVFAYDDAPYKPTIERPPLLPLLLAVSFRIFGHRLLPFQLIEILINLFTCWLVYLALLQLAPNLADLVFLILLLCPFQAAYAGAVWFENLAAFFLVLAFVLPVLMNGKPRWLLAGIALGALGLARDVYLLLVPFILFLLILQSVGSKTKGYSTVSALLLLAGALAVVTPWTIRNFRLTGEFIPVSKGLMGFNLWVGTWERYPTWMISDETLAQQAFRNSEDRAAFEKAVSIDNSSKADSVWLGLALQRIGEEPGLVLRRWLSRWWQVWLSSRFLFSFRPAALAENSRAWTILKGILFLWNAAIVVLGAFGLSRAFFERSKLRWFAIPIFYTTFAYLPFHNTEARYSQPVLVFMILFAAVELQHLFGDQRNTDVEML
jgi:4-amino-4-deoxy-L-arabinose transferase-like glycosyltransferase